jgi:hypothetical protein
LLTSQYPIVTMKALHYFLLSNSQGAMVYNLYLMTLCVDFVESRLFPKVVSTADYKQWADYLSRHDELITEPSALRAAYQVNSCQQLLHAHVYMCSR